ncbi:MAG: hypothetical protein WBC44_20685 [Planctomycetaceae bacterium]
MQTAERHSLWGRAGRYAAVLSSGLLCSCASTATGPLATTRANPSSGADPLTTASLHADEGVARISKPAEPGAIRPVNHIALAGAEVPGQPVDVQFTAADARVPLMPTDGNTTGCPPYGAACSPYGGCPPYGAAGGMGVAGPIGTAMPRPDEFLCDGGDRMPPIHYDRTFRNGLDTEDTVGEWTDPAGGRHVTPSNKVCVYSPRYGEVRTFGLPVEGTRVQRLVSANEIQRGVGLNGETLLDTEVQKTRLGGARVRTRASGLLREQELLGFDNSTIAALNLKDVPPLIGTAFLHRGELQRGEEAFLAKGMQSAVVWTRTQFPVITAVDVSAQEVRTEFRPSEMVGLEDMDKPGVLRIVKLADKSAAAEGEIITFTIRYDNLGDKPVHHIRIVDNLTPRLELVEESGTTDRPGRLEIEPNGEGSFVLTFVIDEPLPGKTGGVVTFQARVK